MRSKRRSVVKIIGAALAGVPILMAAALLPAVAQTNVTTYHYDTLRTGWDQIETILTPEAVASSAFGLLGQVPLDEQVDAQPLFVAGEQINGAAHDVVYVATENNTIYAIDANTGLVLLSNNYGAPVPRSALLNECNNNSANVGITSTPVIDLAAGTLYAITYTYEAGNPTFRIHAIDLGTLVDKVAPVQVQASARLKNRQPFYFVAANQRQRAALLEVQGNIYAGFASWCDSGASRGWVLGWNAATLTPLPSSELVNRRSRASEGIYLSSVWMSGYGIASDGTGLFFSTGNSDTNGKTYNDHTNLSESVLDLSADLTSVQDFFTPKGGPDGWSALDKGDADFGSGGVLLLPNQPGPVPHMAVAAGKAGPMYLLNRDRLGGLGAAQVTLGTYPNNACWCGQSYYTGADGVGRVVASTGFNITVWTVQTSPAPTLLQESQSVTQYDLQDPGAFTTVSSNGIAAGTAVIWTVQRPADPVTNDLWLRAFDPANGSATIYQAVAGNWPFAATANADLVPVVANGQVFVASYGNLSIFGLMDPRRHKVAYQPVKRPPDPALPTGVRHQLCGVVTAVTGNLVSLKLRNGRVLAVDVADASARLRAAPLVIGHASLVRGDYDGGTFRASAVLRQKDDILTWAPDR